MKDSRALRTHALQVKIKEYDPSGKLAFGCDICNISFKKKKNLKDHILQLHGEILWKSWEEAHKATRIKRDYMYFKIQEPPPPVAAVTAAARSLGQLDQVTPAMFFH